MEYYNNLNDPDWGHKPEDDDLVVDESIQYLLDSSLKSSIESNVMDIPYNRRYERGYKYFESRFYQEALDEFIAGDKEYGCPKCATMIGTIIADELWNQSRSYVSRYQIIELGDNPIPYLEKGVAANLPEAMGALAFVYANPGKYHNESKSMSLMKKAAKLGNPWAKAVLDEYQRSRPSLLKSVKLGFTKASIEAFCEVFSEKAGNLVESNLIRLLSKHL